MNIPDSSRLIEGTVLLEALKANPSGGTLSLIGNLLPVDGYWVALPIATYAVDLADPYEHDPDEWYEYLKLIVNVDQPSKSFVGWWQDLDVPTRPILVEPVIYVQHQPVALVVAKALGQRYIFDIANKISIQVNPQPIQPVALSITP